MATKSSNETLRTIPLLHFLRIKNEKIGGFMFEKNCDNDKGGALKNLKFKSICILIKSHIQSGIHLLASTV